VVFYVRSDGLWPLAVVWTYAGLAWLALQPFLFPLLLAAPEEGLPRRYWRAAVLAGAHPGTSLLMLGAVLVVTLGSVLAPPVYPLLGMALLAVLGTQAFSRLRAGAETRWH
jgi:hypothetical protein